jgi:hypothetical protein
VYKQHQSIDQSTTNKERVDRRTRETDPLFGIIRILELFHQIHGSFVGTAVKRTTESTNSRNDGRIDIGLSGASNTASKSRSWKQNR